MWLDEVSCIAITLRSIIKFILEEILLFYCLPYKFFATDVQLQDGKLSSLFSHLRSDS